MKQLTAQPKACLGVALPGSMLTSVVLGELRENGLAVHEFAPLLLVYLQYITIYKYRLVLWLLSEKRKDSVFYLRYFFLSATHQLQRSPAFTSANP